MREPQHHLPEGKSLTPADGPEPVPAKSVRAMAPPPPNGKSSVVGTVFAGQVLRVRERLPDAYAAFLEEL